MLDFLWPRQESNLDLELRKLLYYPLYYKALIRITSFLPWIWSFVPIKIGIILSIVLQGPH